MLMPAAVSTEQATPAAPTLSVSPGLLHEERLGWLKTDAVKTCPALSQQL